MARQKEIVLCVTASIAIYKACDITRRLKEEGCAVSVVMTKEAEEFIRPALFANLSGNKVLTGMFSDPGAWDIEHVSLADRAGVVLIAPATANIIAKLAAGICDDLLTCVVSATRAKVVIAPAMNENMYLNPITQGNIKKLQIAGAKFIGPVRGKLACGKAGMGCLAGVDAIVQETLRLLK
ncbi:MAG: flavoprotein [Candidatus Omnitrophica bacterium]|nr:flavoprotein [Candidatus Omnitrophota bacterium]